MSCLKEGEEALKWCDVHNDHITLDVNEFRMDVFIGYGMSLSSVDLSSTW